MILPSVPECVIDAADAILRGELVGMPTETVYGIAADVFNVDAVQQTFRLKGRPADNPLIVHLSDASEWAMVAAAFPEDAEKLARAFWPGPLSLVLPKRPEVPRIATGGLETVAVRVPGHPIARLLIASAGTPLTAPSANRFMALSPTNAEDIVPEIEEGLYCILDGGPCEIGIESTVVDLSDPEPKLLRPGMISRHQIELVLGKPVLTATGARKSPGQYPRHYAPNAPICLVNVLGPEVAGITFRAPQNAAQIQLSSDPVEYARKLFATLRTLDRLHPSEIWVELLPESEEWEAVRDRLLRATTPA